MIAVDTDILVYAHRKNSDFHPKAERVIRELGEERSSWAIPWPCIHEFLPIAPPPRIYHPPGPREIAMDQVAAWMESPSLVLRAEDEGTWDVAFPLFRASRIKGGKIYDGRIAATCLLHGARAL